MFIGFAHCEPQTVKPDEAKDKQNSQAQSGMEHPVNILI